MIIALLYFVIFLAHLDNHLYSGSFHHSLQVGYSQRTNKDMLPEQQQNAEFITAPGAKTHQLRYK